MSSEPAGRSFWLGAALGGVIMAFGAYGLLSNLEGVALTSWLKTFGGGLVAHDLVFAPLVVTASVLLCRAVPARARAPLQVAVIVSGALVVVAFPVVHGAGRVASNPSLLPSDRYGTRLLVALAVIFVIAAICVVVRVRRARIC